MDKVFLKVLAVKGMMDNGKMTNKRGLALKVGKMVRIMKDILYKVKKMEKVRKLFQVNIIGAMVHFMKVILLKM